MLGAIVIDTAWLDGFRGAHPATRERATTVRKVVPGREEWVQGKETAGCVPLGLSARN